MEEYRLVKRVYKECKQNYLERKTQNWCQGIHKLLVKYQLNQLWDNPSAINDMQGIEDLEDQSKKGYLRFWKQIVRKQVQKIEELEWKEALKIRPKLRIYQLVKEKLELENYLMNHENRVGTTFLTSLRTGTNILRIEIGRWKREQKEERVCTICSGEIEDEEHFLVYCKAYSDLREKFVEKICECSKGNLFPSFAIKTKLFCD